MVNEDSQPDSESTPLDLDAVYEPNPLVVSRVVADERILIPVHRSVGDKDAIYVMNETAAWLWEALDGHVTVGEVVARTAQEFDGDPDVMADETKEVFRQMRDAKAVVLRGAEPGA